MRLEFEVQQIHNGRLWSALGVCGLGFIRVLLPVAAQKLWFLIQSALLSRALCTYIPKIALPSVEMPRSKCLSRREKGHTCRTTRQGPKVCQSKVFREASVIIGVCGSVVTMLYPSRAENSCTDLLTAIGFDVGYCTSALRCINLMENEKLVFV